MCRVGTLQLGPEIFGLRLSEVSQQTMFIMYLLESKEILHIMNNIFQCNLISKQTYNDIFAKTCSWVGNASAKKEKTIQLTILINFCLLNKQSFKLSKGKLI